MKNIVIIFLFLIVLSACEAGKFTPQRNRLHTIGRENICQQNPYRCIDGTNIDW